MSVKNSLFLVLLMLGTNACAGGPPGGKLVELRQLPDEKRALAFHELDDEEKIELFFLANRRHPPYSGLNDAISREGSAFLVRLRRELDERGGVPEVLSFMSIVFDMKIRGLLSSEGIQALRIDGICKLAERSEYCPTLAAKILAQP